MKYLIPLLLVTNACALTPDMTTMEEPARTNRSATAWLASDRPMVTFAATTDYLGTLVATSSYNTAMESVSSILAGYTDRFSTNWSYGFHSGGGIDIDTLVVRNRLTVERDATFDIASAYFLSATNSVRLGGVSASTATLRGPTLPIGTPISQFGSVTSTLVSASSLSSPDGLIRFSAPATFLSQAPMFRAGMGSPTNDPPSAEFLAYGEMRFGHYAWGLLHFGTVVNGPFRFSTVQGMGLYGDGSGVAYDMGPVGFVLAGWNNVPVLTTLRPLSDYDFSGAFWKFSYEDTLAAYGTLTNSVLDMFVQATNTVGALAFTGGEVAGYTNALPLIALSPSYTNAMAVFTWQTNLVALAASSNQSSSITGLVAAAVSYGEASRILINEASPAGVVNVAYSVNSPAVSYARYRQMRPQDGQLHRISMQLTLAPGYSFPTNTARYSLTMNGNKLLTHTVSAAGETGPAFAFLDAALSPPGYLYLDVSDLYLKYGTNLLNATGYCVNVELLRGQTTCQ